MASNHQYNFFKYIFELEYDRYKELMNRAKIFFGIITFYTGVIFLKYLPKTLTLHLVKDFILFASVFFLTLAFLSNIIAMAFFKYENVTTLTRVLQAYSDSPMNDEEFNDHRLVDYSVATERNRKQNNKRVLLLNTTLACIFVCVLLHILYLLMNI